MKINFSLRVIAFSIVFLTVTLVGCGSGGDKKNPGEKKNWKSEIKIEEEIETENEIETEEETIGPEGGTIAIKDAEVLIPPGALTIDTMITVHI